MTSDIDLNFRQPCRILFIVDCIEINYCNFDILCEMFVSVITLLNALYKLTKRVLVTHMYDILTTG